MPVIVILLPALLFGCCAVAQSLREERALLRSGRVGGDDPPTVVP